MFQLFVFCASWFRHRISVAILSTQAPALGQASESLGFEDFPEAADAPPVAEEVATEPAAVTDTPAEVTYPHALVSMEKGHNDSKEAD